MSRLMIAFVSLHLFVAACNNGASSGETADRKSGPPAPKTREDSLFHEVMEGHDAGMAKILKLRRSIKQAKHELDSLGQVPAKQVNAAYKQSLIDLQAVLIKADGEMFTWMQEFKADTLSDNKELRIKYLQSEKEKVTVVKEHIFSAMQQVDSLFKQ